ncbi:uncharacterized protein [Periplaneta americana]|uniref:uncharacterized protein n=1 Tax=Periplaneta americana TaxID=6978 RepID=UPI0037E7F72B
MASQSLALDARERMLRYLLLLLLLSIVFAEDDLRVTVKQGALRGRHLTSRKGRQFASFEGIPFAKPPVGDLRFRDPQPPDKWKGVLDATKPVPKCTQRNVYRKEKLVAGQEDCLFINVYTPYVKGPHLLDVMVYVHGGGWIAGSGVQHHPHYLLDEDVVLVTFNYRLGPLGFLSTGDAVCPGNNGLKDQVAALRWVRDNIAAFGGNSGSVTIFGESAGGASVHYLMLSPMSRGLFHRAISQSGTALCSWSFAPNGSSTSMAEKLGGLFNCPTQNSSELVSCLRSKDAIDITATDKAFMEWSIDPLIPFKPVLEVGDDAFLPAAPSQLIQNAADVPWMTGVNSQEGAFPVSRLMGEDLIDDFLTEFERLAPMMLFYREGSPRKDEITKRIREFYFKESIAHDNVTALVDMFTDGWFLHGADRAVELHSAEASAPVYYYYFTYRGSNTFTTIFGDASRDYGVSHADDLIYLFPTESIFPGTQLTEEDNKMIDVMTSLWTNFARTGKPTSSSFHGVEWPSISSPENKEYLQIGVEGLEVKHGLLRERIDFWNSLPLGISTSTTAKDELSPASPANMQLALLLLALATSVCGDSLEVTIKQGTLKGHQLTSRKGREIFAFQKIPYAKAPVGDLRFKSPRQPEPWEGILDATKPAPKCIQRNIFTFEEDVSGEEDCLYLNVYTPQTTGNLDVMVYIHGGGWLAGTGSFVGPQLLLDRDVVLVTINFRLGPLGFLSTGDAVCPGNNGLKDQVAALLWVRDNIASFGGNPGSVTIFGESAGGASVHYHLLSPASRGLFHRAISESGTSLGLWAFAPNGSSVHHTRKMASLLSCPEKPSKALMSCLRRRDVKDIIKTDTEFMEWSIDPTLTFRPVLESEVAEPDQIFLPAHPLNLIKSSSNVPWMTGVTSADGAFVASRVYGKNLIEDMDARFDFVGPLIMHYNAISKSEQEEISKKIRDFYFGKNHMDRNSMSQVVNMFTDSWFLSGADQSVKKHLAQGSAPIYYYYFDYRGTDSYSTLYGDPKTDFGTSHSDELLYVLHDEVTFLNRTLSEDDEKMVDIMTSIWANFARTGDPTPDNNSFGTWPRVSSSEAPEFGHVRLDGVHVDRGLLTDRAGFWASLPIRAPVPTTHRGDEL